MKVSKLLNNIETVKKPDIMLNNREIYAVACDSREVSDKTVFVAIKGSRSDGHDYAKKASDKGAIVVAERDLGLKNQIIVADSRKAYALLSANLNGNPAKKLKIIGVTGTNGKTTVSTVIKQTLERCGKKVGLIGTVANEIGELRVPARYTTPDAAELHVLLKKMCDAGCEYLVMEVSSHALDQLRLYGIEFHCGVFTNLTQDHLDYHGTMEEYFGAKAKLFLMSKYKVINIDDSYGKKLAEQYKEDTTTIAIDDTKGDFLAKNIKTYPDKVQFELLTRAGISRCILKMPGKFSVYNALCSVAAVSYCGIDIEDILVAIKECVGVRGRAQVIKTNKDFTVICDYAHTPDGLQKILDTINDYKKDGRVITVFGCAGERDGSKRAQMGDIVSARSDYSVVTSDNPRSEDPDKIISEVVLGIAKGRAYKAIADRYKAIEFALKMAQSGDIILLAGKGHEEYQALASCTIYFDEEVVVREIIERM